MMEQKDFKKIVEDYICPILTGSKIDKIISPPTSKSDLATMQSSGGIHLRPSKESDYEISISRSQPFKGIDKKIVNSILNEIANNYNKLDEVYNQRIISYAIEVGICKYISQDNCKLLFKMLDKLDAWAIRTYEGKNVTFSLYVDFNNNQEVNDEHPDIIKVLEEDFSALISNSFDNCMQISARGALIGCERLIEGDNLTTTPHRFNALANLADTDNKICLTLTAK